MQTTSKSALFPFAGYVWRDSHLNVPAEFLTGDISRHQFEQDASHIPRTAVYFREAAEQIVQTILVDRGICCRD